MKAILSLVRPQEFRRIFKKEDTRFIMFVGLKVSGISLGITLFIYYFLFQVSRLNYAFFASQGFPVQDESVFFDYIMREAIDNAPVLFCFHVFLYFIGTYVGWLILRPFRVIGEYCEEVLENPNAVYMVDEFSNYKLLTRFSEFFFEFLRESRRKGEISSNSIPPQYSRIHKPLLDWVFLLHFGILLIIISICSSVFIIDNSSILFHDMTELAMQTLQDTTAVRKYFTKQLFVLDELVLMTITMTSFFYILLGLHLYGMVSGAAFGIFSTMRSFMKGNYFSRVHLVGYAYIRDYTRKLNKYLDYLENNLIKGKPKG
jgi:hypothetical protein